MTNRSERPKTIIETRGGGGGGRAGSAGIVLRQKCGQRMTIESTRYLGL